MLGLVRREMFFARSSWWWLKDVISFSDKQKLISEECEVQVFVSPILILLLEFGLNGARTVICDIVSGTAILRAHFGPNSDCGWLHKIC